MPTGGFYVDGMRFNSQKDYENALKDKAVIDRLKEEYDLKKSNDIKRLYSEMATGSIRFESELGRKFDDSVFELYNSVKRGTFLEEIPEEKTDKKTRTKKSKLKPSKEVSFETLSPDMKVQVEKELKKAERKRRFIMIGAFAIAICCFGYYGLYYYFVGRTENTYEDWAEIRERDDAAYKELSKNQIEQYSITLDEKSGTPDVLAKYETLLNKNKSLIGWIKIDDTNIDYPVMQSESNDYYLDHNLNQEYDKNGSIFMDCACDVLKPSMNLILYGHHMQSGKMFGSLNKYEDEAYCKKHAYIEFDTIYEEGLYEVMYVFRTHVFTEEEVTFKYYQFTDATSESEFDSNMLEMENLSLYDTGVRAQYGDRLLTLSTCDYQENNGRFVVVAKKIQ